MPPSVSPEERPGTKTAEMTDFTDLTDLTFNTEWLDDYTWAATELGSPLPDFSSCSSYQPRAAAGHRDLSSTPSGSSTAAEQKPSPLCKNASKQDDSCIGIITGILKSMGNNSSLCMMGNQATSLSLPTSQLPISPQPTSSNNFVDAVLSGAQEAGCLIRGLLDCSICRAGPQLQLLLTVAFSEVISRYRRVIGTYQNMQRQPEKSGLLNTPKDLTPTPLSIGNHRIEGSIETMLVARVIASRLQELEAVMGEILVVPGSCPAAQGKAPEGGDQATPPTGPALTGLLGEMYTRRDSFLAEQLSAAEREVTELLTHQEETKDGSCAPVP